ncbi:MAG: hypothetical protein ABII25_00190 [bacterium]
MKPIIHIIGLPGAGKTTLSKKLAGKFKVSVYYIGKYRSKFPETITGEADAWINLFYDLSKRKWKNCILETTGLNRRECFLRAAFPFGTVATIKLEAKKSILYGRIKKKKKSEQGGEWLFSTAYKNKQEFVKKLFGEFKRVPADIKINTDNLTKWEIYRIAVSELKKWGFS